VATAISALDGATIASLRMVAKAKSPASMPSTKVTMLLSSSSSSQVSSSNSAANTQINHSFLSSSSLLLKVLVEDLVKVVTFTPNPVSHNNSRLGVAHLRVLRVLMLSKMFKPQLKFSKTPVVDSNSTFLAVMNQPKMIDSPARDSTVTLSSHNKNKVTNGALSQTLSSRAKTSGSLPAKNSPVMTGGRSKMLRSSSSQVTVSSSNSSTHPSSSNNNAAATMVTIPSRSSNSSTHLSSRPVKDTSPAVAQTRLVNAWSQATSTLRLMV